MNVLITKVHSTVPRFAPYAKENKKSMVNDKFSDKEYWEGIRDACEYFRDELGIEDAMDTSIAIQAEQELELV